ncbi:MAG TPA: rhomboid family intramembrane serine protease [Candidatus Krumholzibacteria bacterium]|jgi:membrane associated rhomboid family serine protease
MFLPLRDHNPTRRRAYVTIGLIVLNFLVFIYEAGQGREMGLFIARWGATPFELTHFKDLVGELREIKLVHVPGPTPIHLTALTSMFLHGGWLHLGMNMLFLGIFGNNIEDFLGSIRFLALYILWGLFGLALHVATRPSSPIPVVGASGAISGVLGAYLVLYPRARVTSLLFLGFFVQFVEVPAVVLITVWTLFQVVGGITSLGSIGGGTAYWAHVGGLAAGWFMMRWLAREQLEARAWAKNFRS